MANSRDEKTSLEIVLELVLGYRKHTDKLYEILDRQRDEIRELKEALAGLSMRDKSNENQAIAKQKYMLKSDGTLEMIPTVESVRQEVAKEIIERFVNKKNELRKFEYQDQNDFLRRTLDFWCYIDNFVGLTGEEILAELEKEYAGE